METEKINTAVSQWGTPTYFYSRSMIDAQCQSLKTVFQQANTQLCFAVKANTTGGILRRVFSSGLGADIVSGGELHRCVRAGVDPSKVFFSGVGKQDWEIELGLQHSIAAFNVESIDELQRINQMARQLNRTAPVMIRVNPNIDARTNPYISTGLYGTKFGVAETDLEAALRTARELPGLSLVGLGCHLGSQITDVDIFRQASARLARIAQPLLNDHPQLKWLDLGGGLAVRYHGEAPPKLDQYAHAVLEGPRSLGLGLVLELGRWIVAEAGVLLTRVITVKSTPHKHFIVVDAAMNDLLRPSLYQAYHPVYPLSPRPGAKRSYDVVGPICETGDFLALDRELPPVEAGDVLCIGVTGAYGAAMASNYNSRPRPAEVWDTGDKLEVLRHREPLEALWALEPTAPPF